MMDFDEEQFDSTIKTGRKVQGTTQQDPTTEDSFPAHGNTPVTSASQCDRQNRGDGMFSEKRKFRVS